MRQLSGRAKQESAQEAAATIRVAAGHFMASLSVLYAAHRMTPLMISSQLESNFRTMKPLAV